MEKFIALTLFILCTNSGFALESQQLPDGKQQAVSQEEEAATDTVDLSGEEYETLPSEASASHVLARPWYQNIDISGFGAMWFADSGASGTRPQAGFVIKEATLFVEAEVWEDIAFFLELQTNPLQRDQDAKVRTGEVYMHFYNILKKWGHDLLGIKAGRIDIPFGEEYLWQDAPDNPLISNTAAYPWLWDEGILFYGNLGRVGWVAAITDGHFVRSVEDDAEKALNAKIYSTFSEDLFLSASIMRNGATEKGPLLVGGSLFKPVGAGKGASTLGQSPSQKIDAVLYALDAKYSLAPRLDLEVGVGRACIDDRVDDFDRQLSWFSIQGRYEFLAERVYSALRYSEIGTYDSAAGYQLGGEFMAGGRDFGYDAKRLQRSSLGLGWKLNPRFLCKLEVGRDRFEVIENSPFKPGADDREFYVLEATVSF